MQLFSPALELTMGTVNGDTFADFFHGTLVLEMEPFDGSVKKSVIMDNCSIHHVDEVKSLIDEAGILFCLHIVLTTTQQS